jgi:hypothetical protein
VLKRSLVPAYAAKGTLRYRLRRPLLWLFSGCTSLRYRLLARRVAGDIGDYRNSGFVVAGIVGVAGSPSCGVRRTLELSGAVEAMAACPLATLGRQGFNREVIAANVVAGQGLFVHQLRQALDRRGIQVPFQEHELLPTMQEDHPDQTSTAPGHRYQPGRHRQ